MDAEPLNITTLGRVLCVEAGKLYRWYKEVLCRFHSEQVQQQLHRYDLIKTKNNKKEIIPVPIVKPENIGKQMGIDEKYIGKEMHTVITNRETGKIALLAQTLKVDDLKEIMQAYELKECDVETVTRDLANHYKKFCDEVFINAEQTADKFHIISQLLDAEQAVRVRYRQEILREKRLAYQAHKKQEKQKQKQCQQEGKQYEPQSFIYKEKHQRNGETALELLARSRYLLYKFSHQWTENQQARAMLLFEQFPEIKKSYEVACEFRTWMRKENVGQLRKEMELQLYQWYAKAEKADVDELLNFKSMIERNQTIVVNYFEHGYTNAIAENMNRKIQRFITSNQGVRDRDFFYYRLAKYYA